MAEQRTNYSSGPKGPGGPGGPGARGLRGPRPKLKNPGKLFSRLMRYVLKDYGVVCVVVLFCIVASVVASIQGTMFMKTLIDGIIEPLKEAAEPDFSVLASAIARVAGFYLLGIVASFIQSRIMVKVSQGVLRNLRIEVFHHMQSLPIRYFDGHAHGDIMSVYTNDIDTLRQMISQSIPQIISSCITIVSVLVSMIILSIPLTFLTMIMVRHGDAKPEAKKGLEALDND